MSSNGNTKAVATRFEFDEAEMRKLDMGEIAEFTEAGNRMEFDAMFEFFARVLKSVPMQGYDAKDPETYKRMKPHMFAECNREVSRAVVAMFPTEDG